MKLSAWNKHMDHRTATPLLKYTEVYQWLTYYAVGRFIYEFDTCLKAGVGVSCVVQVYRYGLRRGY